MRRLDVGLVKSFEVFASRTRGCAHRTARVKDWYGRLMAFLARSQKPPFRGRVFLTEWHVAYPFERKLRERDDAPLAVTSYRIADAFQPWTGRHDISRKRTGMKKAVTAALFATMVGTTAQAGGYVEPVLEPVVIVEDTSSSAGGILVPVLAIILIALAISSSSSPAPVN